METTQFTIVSTVINTSNQAGLWFGKEKNQLHILGRVGVFCFLSVFMLQLIALVAARNDVERFFECISVIFFCGMGILKLYSLHSYRQRWQNILLQIVNIEKQQLKREELSEKEYESDDEDIHEDTIKENTSYTNKFKTIFLLLRRIYLFTVVIYILSPFLEYGLRLLFGDQTLGYPHILPSWNPLDDVSIVCYIVVILVEAVAAAYCVLVHTAFDVAAIGIMIFACGQFSLLHHECSRIGGKGRLHWLSQKVNDRAQIRIIKCHRNHILIKNIVSNLDSLLRNVLGVYFFLSTLTLCSVALRLKSEHMGVMQLVSLVQYMGATLMQLFLYCSYGDAVMNESSIGAGQGPFGAAIWCLNPKIRKQILFLGFGMMKTQRLHAGPFNSVDLPTFIQIVRAAYSYYAVVGKK